MKKPILCLLLTLLLTLSLAPFTHALTPTRLVDNADLLDESEEEALSALLDEISLRQTLDVVIVTVSDTGSKSPMAFADDFFDTHGYGFGEDADGVLLLISMRERDYWISTCGYGITAFTDAGIDYIGEQMLPDLSDGDYATAFEAFATLCDDFITQAKNGEAYDEGHLPRAPFDFGISLVIALLVGFGLAFIITGSMKSKLKTVRARAGANTYVKKDSLQITVARDIYLYRILNRVPRPKEASGGGSSVHTSSSGRSHGGGGGKF